MWYVVNRSYSTAKARKYLLGECDASHCKTYSEPFYMKSKSLFKKKIFVFDYQKQMLM